MYKGMVCSKCVKIAHPHHKTEELRVFLSKLDEFRHISEENDPVCTYTYSHTMTVENANQEIEPAIKYFIKRLTSLTRLN